MINTAVGLVLSDINVYLRSFFISYSDLFPDVGGSRETGAGQIWENVAYLSIILTNVILNDMIH